MKTRMKVRNLIRDDSIYPRGSVDQDRVLLLCEAYRAKRRFPPVHIDQKNRLLDGWHRRECLVMECGLDAEVDCIVHQCRDDGEALKLAVKLNASHGLPLSRQDRARCLRMASRFGIGAAAMAAVLGTTVSALKARGEGRVAMAPRISSSVTQLSSPVPHAMDVSVLQEHVEASGGTTDSEELQEVVLSRTVEHLAGEVLTDRQASANRQLSGLPQIKLVDDLILLVQSESLDRGNERLMERLEVLSSLLDSIFASAPVA